MSTEIQAGWEGTFTYTGCTLRVMSAQLSESTDVNDASGIGVQYRRNKEGMKVLRGTVAGYALYDSTNGFTGTGIGQTRTADGATFTLTPKNGATNGFTGTAIISGINYGHDANGNDTQSFSFVTNGAYTVT